MADDKLWPTASLSSPEDHSRLAKISRDGVGRQEPLSLCLLQDP